MCLYVHTCSVYTCIGSGVDIYNFAQEFNLTIKFSMVEGGFEPDKRCLVLKKLGNREISGYIQTTFIKNS